MAETLFDLSFESSEDLLDSRQVSSQGNGEKQIGTIGGSNDSALNVSLAGGEFRSEIGPRSYRFFEEGGRYTIEWQMYVPENFSQPQSDRDWGTIVHQWGVAHTNKVTKLENPGQSYLLLENDGELLYRPATYSQAGEGNYNLSHQTYDLGNVEKNKWINFKQELIPASDNTGLIKIWKDGELVVDHRAPTLPPRDGYENFGIWKIGAYTQRNNPSVIGTRSLWYDDIVLKELTAEEELEVEASSESVPAINAVEAQSDSVQTNFDISGMPIEFWNQPVGTQVSRKFTVENADNLIDLTLKITAFDIDEREEVKLFLNGREIALPEGIIELNGGQLSDTMSLERNILVEGTNEIVVEFADDLDGATSGFVLEELSLTS